MACVAGVETGRIGGIKGRGIGECGKGMVFHSNVAHLGAKTVAQKGVEHIKVISHAEGH